MGCLKISSLFFENLAEKFPSLKVNLRLARYNVDAAEYVKKAFISSLFIGGFFLLFFLGFLSAFGSPVWISFVLLLISGVFTFFFFINKPAHDVLKAKKATESEIVSAIRFLILELRSEHSLYNAISVTSDNFTLIGIYFDEIVNDVKLGRTMEAALNNAVELCPSIHLRSVYWQLLNSLQTGADITESLTVLLGDIVDEQKIKVEEYGRELNALSLFYMMVAIIIPTIGLTILFAVLTFLGFTISIWVLLVLWIFLSLIQYIFLKFSSNRRPSVEAH